MRRASLLAAGLIVVSLAAVPAQAETADSAAPGPLAAMLQRLREQLGGASPTPPPAEHGADRPIIGTPEPAGEPITGEIRLPPSAQFAGREAALLFRFQQRMQTGSNPWPLRSSSE